MRKNVATKLIILLIALVLVVTAIPMGNVTALAAAKKPGAVTKITKSEVNPTAITIQYNKAKNAKGYQIRTYKGKKLVKSAKTKNTSYTIKGLSAETKYTIKVRVYNGSKYGKEKSITVKTETKNLAVTSLKASIVTKDSVKITYKKALNAKGYQIRVYKGSIQVANAKTNKTSYTVNKLSEGTKYTIKVRAYKGSKYGKEKSLVVNTPASDPETPDDDTDTNSGIVMPGESTSTGDKLVAEYNAYVLYEAESLKNSQVTFVNPQTEYDTPFWGAFFHTSAMYQYNTAYDDKYSLFKYKAGTPNALVDFEVDVLNACGYPAERYYNMANDMERFGGYDPTPYENRDALIVTMNGNQYVWNEDTDYTSAVLPYNLTKCEEKGEVYVFIAECPDCHREIVDSKIDASFLPTVLQNLSVTGTISLGCECTGTRKYYKYKMSYTVDDIPNMPHRITLTELVPEKDYHFLATCPDCSEIMESTCLAENMPGMLQDMAASEEKTISFWCGCTGERKEFKFEMPYTINDLPTMPHYITLENLVTK